MAARSYQLAVDIRDQLTVAQDMCNHQPMVETQELRFAFAERLNHALDQVAGVRRTRGRNVDLYLGIKDHPSAKASKQATHKWLAGESMPGRGNMLAIADWLKVRIDWLAHGEGEMFAIEQASVNDSHSTATKVAPKAGSSAAQPLVVQVIGRAIAEGKLTAADSEELRRMAVHLINKNAQAGRQLAPIPAALDGLADAALRAAENGDNPDDLLKMLEKGMSKQRPKEELKAHEAREKRTR